MQNIALIDNSAISRSIFSSLQPHQLRVLHVRPSAKPEAPLICHLSVQRPLERRYKALSYIWGDPTVTVPITVDGCPFNITTNLEAGLRQLRSAYEASLPATSDEQIGNSSNDGYGCDGCEQLIAGTRYQCLDCPDTDFCGDCVEAARSGDHEAHRLLEACMDLTVWVDAVCINQHDTDERNEQVRLMHETYASAWEVMVWLGPEENDSGRAIEFISHWAGRLRAIGVSSYEDLLEDGRISDHINQRLISLLTPDRLEGEYSLASSSNWLALTHFVSRPWWYRLWIFQEIVLAHSISILCGPHVMLWADMLGSQFLAEQWSSHTTDRSAASMLGFPTSLSAWRSAYREMRVTGKRNPMFHPLSLVKHIAGRHCSDPRDKLFGFVGMQALLGRTDIVHVDYRRSAEQVYQQFAKDQILHWQPSLAVINFAGLGRGRSLTATDLPSWVPDWRDHQLKTYIMEKAHYTKAWMRWLHLATASISDDGRRLTVPGLRFDCISAIDVDSSGGFAFELLGNDFGLYPTQCSRFHALFRTMLEDHVTSSFQEYRITSRTVMQIHGFMLGALSCMCQQRLNKLNSWPSMADVPSDSSTQPLAALDLSRDLPPEIGTGSVFPWSLDVYTTADNAILTWPEYTDWNEHVEHMVGFWKSQANGNRAQRRLYRTAKGYFGAGPTHIQEGDVVCVLFGGETPFLLRRREGVDGYLLVGETYVHGIMDGEALDERQIESADHSAVTRFDIY
ncbi:hypothetical protein LTR85_011475 [Meristemomyces frigidus]|nr:hypothetical protein LTR85_011475 [Meristemomyces frigidus]